MKSKKIIASILLMAGMQAGWAQQKVVLHLSNNQRVEYNVLQVDSITFTEKSPMIRSTIWDFIMDEPMLSELMRSIISMNLRACQGWGDMGYVSEMPECAD